MSDGRTPRRCQVILLDERRLDFTVQPPLLVSELLDMVVSHINLREKEYFGLYLTNDIGNKSWLHLDRKVLDHDLPKYADPILFYFAVRFYVPNIIYFKDKVTVELFFLQAKSLIFKGNIHCKSDVVFQLGAYVLQAGFGDFTNEENARNDMKKVPILPTRTLKEHPSITYCEDMVIGNYRELKGMGRGQAIVEYLNIFRNVPTFGVHYYEVKDKGNIPWWIGISAKGVGVYDFSDKTKPRKIYQWDQINNLHFKERKFSVEVKNLSKISEVSFEGTRPRSNSLGRRHNQESLMHTWYASTVAHAKEMWAMAVGQHSFYLDLEDKLSAPRTLHDIVKELSRSNGSLSSSVASVVSDSSDPSESCASSTGGESGLSTEIAQKEMVSALATRKEALQARLAEKVDELRKICFHEATITGEYPPETPFNPRCSPPPVRRRVGTAFAFSEFVVKSDAVEQREEKLGKLQRDFEILSKITDAAEKLANDTKANKNVRKSRKLTYQKSFSKLKSVEQAIKRLKESQLEEQDNNSLRSFGDEVDNRSTLTRRHSFNAATGQSNSSSTESFHSGSSSQNNVPSADSRIPNGNVPNEAAGKQRASTISSTESYHSLLSNPFQSFQSSAPPLNGDLPDDLDNYTTPEFASSTKINEMLYHKNSPLHYRRPCERSNSNSSSSSYSSITPDFNRPPPPSYSQSRFHRRESALKSHEGEQRRGSTPAIYLSTVDGLENQPPSPQAMKNIGQQHSTAAPTKVRYVGGSSSDSECNSDDTGHTVSSRIPSTSVDYDNNVTNYWLKTVTRNRSNIAAAAPAAAPAPYNCPSKLGIMSRNESTGSYFVNELFPETGGNKPHFHASATDLSYQHNSSLPRSYNSSYSLRSSPVPVKREPLMRRFFHDSQGDWPDGEDPNITLV